MDSRARVATSAPMVVADTMDTTAVATIIVAEASTSAHRITTMITMITLMRVIAAGFIAEPSKPEVPIGGAVIGTANTKSRLQYSLAQADVFAMGHEMKKAPGENLEPCHWR